MVTFVNQVPGINPQAEVGMTKPAELSDLAKSALSSFGDMQAEFTKVMDQAETVAKAPTETEGVSGMQAQLDQTAEMMHVSTQVQTQLLQFSMATSVSSNMGRNLSTFLKGQ